MFRELEGWWRAARWVRILPLVLAGALLVFGYQARMRLVDQALPYCQHIDEHTWTQIAIRMMKTGDLNPHRFTKPSVMVYLDTAAFSLGMLKAGMSGAKLPALETLHEGGYPYYSSPAMIRTTRQVHALLSLVPLTFAALISRRIAADLMKKWEESGSKGAQRLPQVSIPDLVGLTTLGLGLLSATYLKYSHWYLGVDLIGCVAAMATIAYLLLHPQATRALTFAIVAGLLSGLCIGTKYNLYPIAASVVLTIGFRYRAAWVSTSVVFAATMVATFIATTPYALLDLPAFVSSAAGEAYHYATGHGKYSREPGLPAFLAYGASLPQNYGWGLALAALVGVATTARYLPRSAGVVLSYPLLLWIYMAGQRAFFSRNLLVLQLILPIFAGVGLLVLVTLLRRQILARAPERWLPHSRSLALGILTFCVMLTCPWSSVAKGYKGQGESRNEAASWVRQRPEKVVLVAEELEMDVRTLGKSKRVVSFSMLGATFGSLKKEYPGALVLAPVIVPKGKFQVPEAGRLKVLGQNAVKKRKRGATRIRAGNPRLIIGRLGPSGNEEE